MLKAECSICGARRKYKSLLYDQSLNAYCGSAMACTKHHPNSIWNKQQRGSFLELMQYEEALMLQKQRVEYSYEESASMFNKRVRTVNMHKLLTGSISFRVQNEAQADYISYTMGKMGTNKISDVLHMLMNKAIESDQGFIAHYAQRRNVSAVTPVPAYPIEQEEPQPRERLQSVPSRTVEPDEGIFTL